MILREINGHSWIFVSDAAKRSNESFSEDIDLKQFGIDESDYEQIRMQNIPNYTHSSYQPNGKLQPSLIQTSKSESDLLQTKVVQTSSPQTKNSERNDEWK